MQGSDTSDLAYPTREIVATVVSSDHVNDIVDGMKKAQSIAESIPAMGAAD